MTNQELCTQYEFIVSMIESGNADKVVEILSDAIDRIKGTSNKNSGKDEKSQNN